MDKITIEDILKIKEKLVTHYCFVHDQATKTQLEALNMPNIEIKVNNYIEKGKIILMEKKSLQCKI